MKSIGRFAAILILVTGLAGLFCVSSSGDSADNPVFYFPHLADGGGFASSWHLTGLSAEASVVTIELFDGSGNPLSLATDNGTSSIFRFALGPSSSGSLQTLNTGSEIKVGWAKVTATHAIGVSEHFRLTASDGAVISQAEVPASSLRESATLFIPDSRNTAIAFLNPNSAANTLSFNLLDSCGNVLATGSRTFDPNSQVALYQNQIPGLEHAAAFDGSLEVTSSSPFAVMTLAYQGLTFASAPVLAARAGNRAGILNEMARLRTELDVATSIFLSPSADDIAPYASFLRQPDTGMILLTPRGKYESIIPMRGGGSYFSFFLLTHEYGYGSDIELQQNYFMVGFAGLDFGFFTVIGNMPLDNVGLGTAGVQYLASYSPPSTIAGARSEQQRASSGFTDQGFTYANRVSAQLNSTYALRSVSYDGSDQLVIFRVVRFDTDGSAVILWKRLFTFPVPHAS